MKSKEWIKNLTVEDMPNEELKLIAEYLGIETALDLIENFPGININIPKNAFRRLMKEYIKKKYNGTRASQINLALECGVTAQYITQVARKNK